MNDPLKPTLSLLIKLGSIAVHTDELLSAKGHAVDKEAINTLLENQEVIHWIAEMDKLAMLPVKR